MSLISPELQATVVIRLYRMADFFVTSILDDPAWLALMFC